MNTKPLLWSSRAGNLARILCLALAALGPTTSFANSFASATDGTCVWSSTLHPDPAIRMSYCGWLANALDVQGYNSDNGWTITYSKPLNGTISISTYEAWVGFHRGGANMILNYAPGSGDPTGGAVHWLQVVRTTDPIGTQPRYDEGGGYYQYLDNQANLGSSPFYPSSLSGAWGLEDGPFRSCPHAGYSCPDPYTVDWDAQTFLATWDADAKKIDVYDQGVWWGFNYRCDVPESGPLTIPLLIVMAILVLKSEQLRLARN